MSVGLLSGGRAPGSQQAMRERRLHGERLHAHVHPHDPHVRPALGRRRARGPCGRLHHEHVACQADSHVVQFERLVRLEVPPRVVCIVRRGRGPDGARRVRGRRRAPAAPGACVWSRTRGGSRHP
eukprot:4960764-Prymnesium_polylepis.2